MLPENYTLMDASLEIALMLLAAFLLGWLFCWLMKKLFGKKQIDEIEYSADADMPDLTANRPLKTGLSASSRERLYDPEVGIPRGDADVEIPTVNTPEVNVNSPSVSASAARPRIDLPDLDGPKLDLEGKLDAGLSAGKGALGKGAGIAAAGIGSIAAGAVALKGQIGDKVDDIDLKMPSAEIPDIDLPDASLPNVNIPDIDLPDVELPDVNIPEIDLPSAELPDVDLPELELPDVNVPEIDLPSAELPDVDLPDVELPDVNIPDINLPDADLPDVNIPEIDLSGKLDAGVEMGKGALGKGVGVAAAGLGSIAAGAASLKGKVGETIDGVDLKMPSVETPEIDLPDAELPDVELPDVNVPDIDLPDADLPDVSAPDIDLPDAEIPDVDLPDVELPDVNAADIDLPNAEVNLPDAKLPDVDVPDLSGELDAGLEKGKGVLGKDAGIAAAGLGSLAAGAMSLKDKATDKVDDIKETLNAPDLPKVATPSKGTSTVTTPHSGDDLTRITGINDKVVSALNANGVKTYADLEKLDRTTLKRFLNETDDASLHITEPASWPHQARLCSEHNWSKLREYQDFLSGNRPELTEQTPADDDGSSSARDNLKKIEGIGPFFERTLNEAGITTFAQLKNADRDTLKAIIDAAGPEYHSHEPETWPYQAGLADRGEWKKLKDYIHFMTGRS
ncbi:helix-hairpin-helix domain-containing protein [Leucothrix mucor]|uniref:helix-hairpin-helix domain-containing protein n=1 Tax=Leucothrix mucor TaxID=45248 RepID=UPI0003B48EB9|nr:helix-hairpin-helix domain-containing protein [Leucothrix mucor]